MFAVDSVTYYKIEQEQIEELFYQQSLFPNSRLILIIYCGRCFINNLSVSQLFTNANKLN